jgi:hypothetical protein
VAKNAETFIRGGRGMEKSYQEGLGAFVAEAEKAYASMFATERQAELKTFTQREVKVYEEGRRLSRWLLERHLEQDQNSQPGAVEIPCPHCQRPSQRVSAECETRPVTTLVGDITFPRTKYKCKHCRKSFFPSGLDAGIAQQPAQPRGAQARGGTGRQRALI